MPRPFSTAQLRAFGRAQRGSIAVFFSLALIPLVMLLGVAVDYGRAATARTMMQAALDTAALTLSQQVTSLTAAQLGTQATTYFTKEFKDTKVSGLAVTAAFTTTGGNALTVKATGNYATAFMGLFGTRSIPISSSATTKWGSRLRVALVLDNTGSMDDDGKMVALKAAAHTLLTQLQTYALVNGDVYVSIIPFASDVNVKLNSNTYQQNWIDWTDWDNNYTYYYRGGWYTSKAHSSWNGCVYDRDKDNDVSNAVPVAATKSTLFPADPDNSCPTTLMPLSYDWTALNAKIEAMNPLGGTNQTIGLQWGFQSLTAASPLTVPAYETGYNYKLAIVLLTDGLNTMNRWDGNGHDPSAAVDARTALACANIKAAGITLYTIQVNTGGDATSTMLQTCATPPSSDNFSLLTSSTQIVGTFADLGRKLSQLRLAK